jgi:glycosyltransferase involved in cell wall biosynthesis
MEKKILLKSRFSGWPLHSLYSELLTNPPNGFVFNYESVKNTPFSYNIDNKAINPIIKEIIYQFKPIPYILLQKKQQQSFQNYDLIYASQHILFNSKSKWITDLEFANALSAYGNINHVKNIIKKQLESKNCKAILPWSEWSKQTLLKSIDSKKIKNKIKVIPYTVSPKNIERKNHDHVNFLFVGSKNLLNSRNIQFKNLKEVVTAFNIINKKFDKILLSIRSIVTPELKMMIKKNPNITLIESYLSENKLAKLYLDADIFVLPSHETNGIALLEAMSFGLPVIAIGIYDIPEIILHMKNGILIEPPKNMKYYTQTKCPFDYSWKFSRDMKKSSEYIVECLRDSFQFLIENEDVRRNIGKQAKLTIDNGRFSEETRRKDLKIVLEEALE